MSKISEVFLCSFKEKINECDLNLTLIEEIDDFIFEIDSCKNDDKEKIGKKKYKIVYESQNLKLVSVVDENESNDKLLSTWFYNEKTLQNERNMIISDFTEIISKGFVSNDISTAKIISSKNEEILNLDVFLEKICNILPELKFDFLKKKMESNKEKIEFIEKTINPKINEILMSFKNNIVEKVFNFLSNSYVNGDEYVKCIITMSIFNSIKSEEKRRMCENFLSTPMKKVWNASILFKI